MDVVMLSNNKIKKCYFCKQEKENSEFYKAKASKDGLQKFCKDCHKIISKNYRKNHQIELCDKAKLYYQNNKSNRLNYHRNYRIKIRDLVFSIYGGEICKCCGETEKTFLSIDHINNNGSRHRKFIGGRAKNGGMAFYQWLKKNNFPLGFQVLCMNCQFGKARNKGICPHVVKSSIINNYEGRKEKVT